jgi:hypothetical protein
MLGIPSDREKQLAVEVIASGCGVVYGIEIDPNPEGTGFRLRAIDPRHLTISTSFFNEIPGVMARGDSGGELLLFTDHFEFLHAAEEAEEEEYDE